MAYFDDISLSDRVLVILNPAHRFLAKHLPSRFARPEKPAPHPSAMLSEHNWLYRATFPRYFERVSTEDAAIAQLKETAGRSTIVYVTKTFGQLEYNYFNHLFLKEGLPLVQYSNSITLRRFMPWHLMWEALRDEEGGITELGHPSDPVLDGSLTEMIAEGKHILISIPSSDLSDESLFLTGPMKVFAEIIDAQKKSERPISLVPLDFLWDKRPGKTQRTLIDVLFGEKDSPGMIRKTVLFWRHYFKNAQAVIGEPIDLKAFVLWEGGDGPRLATRLRETLMGALKTQRRTITGPPIRPHGWFMQEITGDSALDEKICRLAQKMMKPADDLRDLARRYAREIIADVDHTYIELLDRLLSPVFRRIYESLSIDNEGLKKAKELYSTGPVVFVPNHKSHMDYLILSHIFYHNGMTMPFIAAGINMEFWPVGKIFRRSGAFFIRRAFHGNELYRAVLETYLKILLREGYSQEFFIEGGRSRTGKLLKPRTGMITMLCEAMREAKIPNLNFIPVSITYDRVIEQKSYVTELEGGIKEKEGARHILSLTRFLRRPAERYGSVYVRFGEPVFAAEEAGGKTIEDIAQKICHEINRNAMVTPAAIAATAILALTRRGIEITEIKRNWGILLSFLKTKGVILSERFVSHHDTAMDEALSILCGARLIGAHPGAMEPFYSIDEEKRLPLSFFKNGCAHFLVTIGVVSRLIAKFRKTEAFAIDDLVTDFESCKRLLGHEFAFATRKSPRDHIAPVIDFLLSKGALLRADAVKFKLVPENFWILDLFFSPIAQFVETLWIAFCHATKRMSGGLDEKTLVMEMMKTGQELFLLEKVKRREAIAKTGFENAIRALVSYGVLSMERRGSGAKARKIYSPTKNSADSDTLKAELERLL